MAAAFLTAIATSACAAGTTPSDAISSAATTSPVTPAPTDDASPSEAGTGGAASVTPSASASGEQAGDPVARELEVGDWVVSTVDGLRLREAPGLDGRSLGLLRTGYRGTVIDGPLARDGYEWVFVAWPGLPSGSGCATGPGPGGYLEFCGASGWLATSDANGNAWVMRSEPDCPSAPTTIVEATQLQPGIRLACFGGQELTLTGFVAIEASGRGCYPGYDIQPEWLGPCAVAFVQGEESQFDATMYELAVNVHPDIGECQFGGMAPESCPFRSYPGTWVRITGMVDHPAAESCAIEPWAENENAPDEAMAVYQCRERFVVTAIEEGAAP